ncbi:hypothetical protein DAEQUDRAFT_810617 [Daedalea quercina L-15889]|uniref:DUF6533 domain-containing protein n=1 Tax=Daedalea quercina L-15889 TaxID=1314783 RepID=A0A165R8K7_9APHY|nr:hypothetical protein DAEQUDRAFT_810617 [Daedalea quercina L-15889]
MPTVLTPLANATSGSPYLLTGSYAWLDERVASYIRIASVSIAAYDYLLTLPAEWRFYKSQRSWRLSTGCILFILIRYISMVVLAINTAGYFARFSPETCTHFFWVGPIFKVLQTMVSQLILGIRTVNISRRCSYIASISAALFIIVTTGEWFTALFHRDSVQDYRFNCTVGENGVFLSAWLYYLGAMIYDVFMLCVSTFYLMRYGPVAGRMSGLVRLMLYDGLGYFVVLTGSNILNVVVYRTSDTRTQSSCAVVGEAVTWIMSQKLLIHLRDAAASANRSTHVVVSRPLGSSSAISRAMRSLGTSSPSPFADAQFGVSGARAGKSASASAGTLEGYAAGDADGDVLAWSGTSLTDLVGNLSDVELDVQVEIQRTVSIEEGSHGVVEEGRGRVPCVVWVGTGSRPVGLSEKEEDGEKEKVESCR